MARVVRSTPANEDLISIWHYIAQDSETAASRLLRKLDQSMRMLADNPLLGEQQDHLRSGLRRFVVGRYLVFYESIDEGIRIVRVFHGARDYENLI